MARAGRIMDETRPYHGRGLSRVAGSAAVSQRVTHAPLRAIPCAPCPRPCTHRLSYRGPSGRVVGAGCAPARPYRRHSAARWLALSWAGYVVLQHSPAFPPQACHNTICLYCDIGFLTSPSAYCNTIHCIAIQFSSSPKSLCHDTLNCFVTPAAKLFCHNTTTVL